MWRNVVEVSIEVSHWTREKKKKSCVCLGVVGEKILVSGGALAVTGKLTGAGHSHPRHEPELQLLPIAGEPWEAVDYCWCSFGIAKQSRPSSRSYIYLYLVILSIMSSICAERWKKWEKSSPLSKWNDSMLWCSATFVQSHISNNLTLLIREVGKPLFFFF